MCLSFRSCAQEGAVTTHELFLIVCILYHSAVWAVAVQPQGLTGSCFFFLLSRVTRKVEYILEPKAATSPETEVFVFLCNSKCNSVYTYL